MAFSSDRRPAAAATGAAKPGQRGRISSERGIALLYFAVTFPVILMLLGLVLDAGWSYYTRKRAQTAADAAALAAVSRARAELGVTQPASCGLLGCQSEAPCPDAGLLSVACSYASSNGFSHGGYGGRQTLLVSADATQNAPSAPGVPVEYWVEVTARHSLSPWFAGMLNSSGLQPAARATAALRRVDASASLYLLNRSSDCVATATYLGTVCGENLLSLGYNEMVADGGIYMSSSNAGGLGVPDVAAGTVLADLDVEAPFTRLMGDGAIEPLLGLGSVNWAAAPQNGFPDGDLFADPMAGRGQPPAPTGLADHPVVGGVIVGSSNQNNPTVLPPGNYYATLPLVGATGTPVTITGNVIFSDGAAVPCGGFCDYVFYGGLVTAAQSQATFSAGRYVFAGAQPVAGGPGAAITVGANAVIQDNTPNQSGEIVANSDAGEIFIFTDMDYPGLEIPAAVQGLQLPQVQAGIIGGVHPQITLHGLNASSTELPGELAGFAPVLFWQDQANTTVGYTSEGRLDMSCGSLCENLLSVPGSQEMIIPASQISGDPGVMFYGTLYGPRGSWLTVIGIEPHDRVAGPFQIISGALQLGVNVELEMQQLSEPPEVTRVSLIR